jgi:uncharacterized protein (DUF427 family)
LIIDSISWASIGIPNFSNPAFRIAAGHRTAGTPELSAATLLRHVFRTIFLILSLQSRPERAADHDGLTKKELTMKLPGPDHPITITANPKRVRVSAGGVVIADTTHALTLKEASYPAVQYVPRGDANLALLARTDRVTHCPYKGDANYFSIKADGRAIENAIWTYETPFPAMAEIAGHLAFYPDKVKIEEVA